MPSRLPALSRRAPWLALALAAACAAAGAETATLAASAYHGEIEPLPRSAEFEARLVEVSSTGAPARTLGRVRIERPPPGIISFEINYDTAAVRQQRRYLLIASISAEGRPWMAGEEPVALLAEGETPAPPPLPIRLIRLPPASPPPPPPSAPAASAANEELG